MTELLDHAKSRTNSEFRRLLDLSMTGY